MMSIELRSDTAMEKKEEDAANSQPHSTQNFPSKRKFPSGPDDPCQMHGMTVEAPWLESMGNESFDGLKHKVAKDMERLKQIRASCTETKNQNQERVLDKMMASYEEAIAILNKITSKEQDQDDLVSSHRPDESDNPSMAASSGMKTQKDSRVYSKLRKGNYKRRVDETWEATFRLRKGPDDAFPDDGYTWRKYGQKEILGSKNPRYYYKCSKQKGCPARKHMQRSDKDPMLFEVVYSSKHSCQRSPVTHLIHNRKP